MKEGMTAYESSVVVLDILELFIDHFEEEISSIHPLNHLFTH